MQRDAVLEGASAVEVETLARLCKDPTFSPPLNVTERLQAKGWIDTAGDHHLLTITGRTLVDAPVLRHREFGGAASPAAQW